MGEEEVEKKWEGKVSAKLTWCTTEQIRPLVADFFSIQKWLPHINTCQGIEGISGQPGCIRYCSKTLTSSSSSTSATGGDSGEKISSWAYEKLIAIDHVEKCYSYEITENNVGYNSFVAKWKLVPFLLCQGEEGCELNWSFVANPLVGMKVEELVSMYDSFLQDIAKQMEEAVKTTEH